MTGCACDIFYYAPLVRPSLQVEETCPATGTPIRLVFTPRGVEHVDPAGAVVPLADDPQSSLTSYVKGAGDIEDIDANECVQSPLFSSAEAGWLAAHPASGVGSEIPSRLAGPNVGPAGPRPLITGRPRANRACPLPGGHQSAAPEEPADAAMSRTIDPQSPERTDTMSSIKHDTDASLADFMAGWDKRLQENEQLPVGFAVLVLTNFGEHPVQSTRLAEVLGRSVSEAEARAQGHCATATPVEDGEGFIRVEDGLISYINPERAKSAPRRWLQIGDRRFGMAGCAPDVFLYAPLVRPSLQVEEICPATGTPIRVVFTPNGVESVDPGGVVVPILPPREFDRLEGMTVKEVDTCMCAQCPFYSSAEAAQGWLSAHPGGRVFPIREAWDLSFHRDWRDRMSALLNLNH